MDITKTFRNSYRYLDVGCAYGGFLLIFAEWGLDALGIKIYETLEKCGALLCQDK
jgi:hypothetical protein